VLRTPQLQRPHSGKGALSNGDVCLIVCLSVLPLLRLWPLLVPSLRVHWLHSHWYEYGYPCTSSSKHEFACIPAVAVHIDTSSVRVLMLRSSKSKSFFLLNIESNRNRTFLYFSCIPSNDLSIEALDRLLTPSRFNASTDRLQHGRLLVIKLFICRPRPPLGWSEREVTGEGVGLVLFLDKQGPRTDIGR